MKPTFCNKKCYGGNSRVSRALGHCGFRSISLNINSIEVMALFILILNNNCALNEFRDNTNAVW